MSNTPAPRTDVPASLVGHVAGPCTDPDCEVTVEWVITDETLADPGAAGLTRDDLIAEVSELAANADMTPHEARDAFLEGRAEVLADDASGEPVTYTPDTLPLPASTTVGRVVAVEPGGHDGVRTMRLDNGMSYTETATASLVLDARTGEYVYPRTLDLALDPDTGEYVERDTRADGPCRHCEQVRPMPCVCIAEHLADCEHADGTDHVCSSCGHDRVA